MVEQKEEKELQGGKSKGKVDEMNKIHAYMFSQRISSTGSIYQPINGGGMINVFRLV